RALVAAFGAELTRILFAVVVDHDVDIYDPTDVIWAMTTRCRPDRDTFVIPDVPSFARDPHQIHWGRLGIDATAPLEWPAEFERKKSPGADGVRLGAYLWPRQAGHVARRSHHAALRAPSLVRRDIARRPGLSFSVEREFARRPCYAATLFPV